MFNFVVKGQSNNNELIDYKSQLVCSMNGFVRLPALCAEIIDGKHVIVGELWWSISHQQIVVRRY